ncbi:hypothetical protein U1Q18_037240, partial [Sarracenia purpurea var. burkii]
EAGGEDEDRGGGGDLVVSDLAKAFKVYDLNGDGFISCEELQGRTEVEEKIEKVARYHGSVKRGKSGGAPLRPPVRGGVKRQMFKDLKLCCLKFIRFLLCNNTEDVSH